MIQHQKPDEGGAELRKVTYVLVVLLIGVPLVVVLTYSPDEPGWQLRNTDSWYVDDVTITQPRSMQGGGVKVCFKDQDVRYTVELFEDDWFKDAKIDGKRSVGISDGSCVKWSNANTELGKEELYLKLTKNSTTEEMITVHWQD